tara:strand:+ start:653 stop:1492 length:840 start_codon:yes stop_codon:yes gene_type:complete
MDNYVTCITNIYNEEYLLPFWLNHHKNIFDKIIIVDHHSTDNSVKICKEIIPGCTIIPHPSKEFASKEHDIYLMKLEEKIKGIKIILNTTEFLFCSRSIKEIFSLKKKRNKALCIIAYSPYSLKEYNPKNNYELYYNLMNKDIKFHKDREGGRYLHNYPNGNYEIGRHITYHNFENTNELFIVWFGYYPLNDNLIQRKLQIKDNIPITDRNPRPGFPMGFAWQHFFSKNKLLEINNSKSKSGLLLKNINMPLFDIIHRYTIDLSCKSPYQKTYLSNFYK